MARFWSSFPPTLDPLTFCSPFLHPVLFLWFFLLLHLFHPPHATVVHSLIWKIIFLFLPLLITLGTGWFLQQQDGTEGDVELWCSDNKGLGQPFWDLQSWGNISEFSCVGLREPGPISPCQIVSGYRLLWEGAWHGRGGSLLQGDSPRSWKTSSLFSKRNWVVCHSIHCNKQRLELEQKAGVSLCICWLFFLGDLTLRYLFPWSSLHGPRHFQTCILSA